MKSIKKSLHFLIFIILLYSIFTIPVFAQTPNDKVQPFQGMGTVSDPYLIKSVEDLNSLRDLVNSGERFDDTYFEQTENLDMKSIKNWEPIGVFESGLYFYGIYNGNGHYISNLTIDRTDNAGLFGMLGGTVMNLGIESGSIKGACVGSITSHSTGEKSNIINCYNKAQISGYRTGGIADNFGGLIINCWNIGQLDGIEVGGITSYYSKSLINDTSYGFQVYNSNFVTGTINNSHMVDISKYDFDSLFKTFKSRSKQSEGVTVTDQIANLIFRGKGTESEPYLISSIEDLCAFRDLVNIGGEFYNCWFLQTENIDLSSIPNWTPIGLYEGTSYFYGVYNGGGKYLSNLNIDRSDNAGFFGKLGGTVMNLGIESGSIKGACVGSLASHSVSYYAMVLNCYNKANISGTTRAGGIADNFLNGYIMNCWNSGQIESSSGLGGICSYSANWVYNCYSIGSRIVDNEFQGTVEISEEMNINSKSYELIAQKLNTKLYTVMTKTNYQHTDFNMWKSNNDGIVYGDKYLYLNHFVFKEVMVGIPLLVLVVLLNIFIIAAIKKQKIFPLKNFKLFIREQWNNIIRSRTNKVKFIILGIFQLCYTMIVLGYINGDKNITKAFCYSDYTDGFMDFFNPMYTMLTSHFNASNFYNNPGTYPPVARFILWFFGQIIPQDILLGGSGKSIRESSFGLLGFFIVFTICFIILTYFINKKGNGNKGVRYLFTFFLLFCSPMIFIIDRGNIIIFSLIFTVIFAFWFDSDSKVKKEIALISLGLATAIKIYPAIFGILLIRKGKWREAMRCAIYGMLLFFLPFAFLGGGNSIILYFNNLFISIEHSTATTIMNTYYFNYTNAMGSVFDVLFKNIDLGRSIGEYTLLPIAVMLIASSLFFKENWKAMLSITLLMVLLPSNSLYYMCAFYIIPVCVFFYASHNKWQDYIYAFLLCALLTPLQFLCGVYNVPQSAIYIFISICQLIILLVIFIELIIKSISSLYKKIIKDN